MPRSVPSRRSPSRPRSDAGRQLLYQDVRWLKLRAVVLADPEQVVCRLCQRSLSTVVDHRIPHRGDLQLFWDHANLQGVCAPCHDWKTLIEQALGNYWRKVLLQVRRLDLDVLLPW